MLLTQGLAELRENVGGVDYQATLRRCIDLFDLLAEGRKKTPVQTGGSPEDSGQILKS